MDDGIKYKNAIDFIDENGLHENTIILYPLRNFCQLFNLENDPLEINNLAVVPEYKKKVDEMMDLLKEWYIATDDTATLIPKTILPLKYDHTLLKQKPDAWQPEHTLKKYIGGAERENSEH